MKVQKMISIPYELAQRLKQEPNASGLIVGLLEKHFQEQKMEDMSVEELEEEISKMELEKKYEEKLKAVRN